MSDANDIHTLWIGDQLSAMELMTLQSFLQHGFTVHLWTYSDKLIPPEGVHPEDAREILSESAVFSYNKSNKYGHGKGSLSGFSDIFRYKLLHERGGIWIDMDITCLRAFQITTPYFFRHHQHIGLVGNVLKAPKGSPLMEWCYQRTISEVTADNTHWLLPIEILKEGVYHFRLESYIQNISNPDSFPVVRELLLHSKSDISAWSVIHWMNEEFRRMGIDKNMAVNGSHYQLLLHQYNIPYSAATETAVRQLKWETSKFNYALLNLKARYNWYREKLGNYF